MSSVTVTWQNLSVKIDDDVLMSVLERVNCLVAKAFCSAPKNVQFIFKPVVWEKVIKAGGHQLARQTCVGRCDTETGDIEIAFMVGWQRVVIHELVHRYDPNKSEKKADSLTKQLVRFIKLEVKIGRNASIDW